MARCDVNRCCCDGEVQQLADDFWMIGRGSSSRAQRSAAQEEPTIQNRTGLPARPATDPNVRGAFAPGPMNMATLNPEALAAWVLGATDHAT
jgi:hypothetical protein